MINQIICGDTLTELRKMPDGFVDTIITSPPYWGLRDYGIKGQIGLEKILEEYINKLLAITAELKRVIKPTGVMFWNHGDCYGGSGQGAQTGYGDYKRQNVIGTMKEAVTKSLQPKCLALQNYRLILRMIDDQGWILRNSICWFKPNHMPSSVKDRFANSYEPVFMLVKNKKYWFDLDSVRIPATSELNYERPRMGQGGQTIYEQKREGGFVRKRVFNYRVRDAEKKSKMCPQFKASKEEIKRYKKNKDARGNNQGGPGSFAVFKSDNPCFTNPAGKNPGDTLIVEEANDFPIFAIEVHTTILGVKEFEDFSNFISVIVNKLVDSSSTMPSGDDDTDIAGLSEDMRDFRQKLLSARPMQPNLISIAGNPYATITVKQSPNEISIEFGRNKWIFCNQGFPNKNTSLNKINSQFFAINTKIVDTPFFILMNWMSGLPLSFDVINQLNILRRKSDCITLSSFHNATITEKQAQDISRMMSNFAKVFFIESMFCSAYIFSSAISKKSMIMTTAKKTADNSSFTSSNFTDSFHTINIPYFDKEVKEKSDVWTIPTQPFPEAHFATFPEKLIEPMIKAGCPAEICRSCGKARVRITESAYKEAGKGNRNLKRKGGIDTTGSARPYETRMLAEHKTIGWTDCKCGAGWHSGIVLDPFMGAATTCVVAKKLGRRWLGIELSPEYIKIAEKRIANTIGRLL